MVQEFPFPLQLLITQALSQESSVYLGKGMLKNRPPSHQYRKVSVQKGALDLKLQSLQQQSAHGTLILNTGQMLYHHHIYRKWHAILCQPTL